MQMYGVKSYLLLQVTWESVTVLQVLRESVSATSHMCCVWTCNEIEGSYDYHNSTKLHLYQKKVLVCCHWHCYLCCALIAIQTATSKLQAIIQANFDTIQELGPKVGGGHPFVRLRYISTVEPLHNGHHWHFVRYSEVSLTQGFLVYFW